MEWISVNERLPEKTEPLNYFNDDTGEHEPLIENHHATVLAYEPGIGFFKAEYSDRGWHEISSISSKGGIEPTHWAEIESPK